MPGVRSQDAQRPRPMAWDAYRSQISLPLTDSLELFERVLRRSLANGDEREYISYPPAQPIAGQFENAIFHLALRTTVVGGTPTVKVVFEDSSDGNNWAILITYTEAGPSDGTYRYQAPTPFGGFLRVRLLISGAGGIGLVLCRGVLSVRSRKHEELSDLWSRIAASQLPHGVAELLRSELSVGPGGTLGVAPVGPAAKHSAPAVTTSCQCGGGCGSHSCSAECMCK